MCSYRISGNFFFFCSDFSYSKSDIEGSKFNIFPLRILLMQSKFKIALRPKEHQWDSRQNFNIKCPTCAVHRSVSIQQHTHHLYHKIVPPALSLSQRNTSYPFRNHRHINELLQIITGDLFVMRYWISVQLNNRCYY